MDDFYLQLGRRISAARQAKEGLTQARLAAAIGLSRPSMVNIEKGRQPLKVHQLVVLADALGLDLGDLVPSRELRDGARTSTIAASLKGLDEPSRGWIERVISRPSVVKEHEG